MKRNPPHDGTQDKERKIRNQRGGHHIVSIDIEDDGSVFITSDDPDGMQKAIKKALVVLKKGDKIDFV